MMNLNKNAHFYKFCVYFLCVCVLKISALLELRNWLCELTGYVVYVFGAYLLTELK